MDVDPFEARTTTDLVDDAALDVARRDARRNCVDCPMRDAVVDGAAAAAACMFAGRRAYKCRWRNVRDVTSLVEVFNAKTGKETQRSLISRVNIRFVYCKRGVRRVYIVCHRTNEGISLLG